MPVQSASNSAGNGEADLHLRDAREALDRLSAVWAASAVQLRRDVPSIAAAEARLAAGIPALTGEPMLDTSELVHVARRIAARLRDLPAFAGAAALVERLERALPALDRDAFALAVAVGAWDAVAEAGVQLGIVGASDERSGESAESAADAFTLVALVDYASRPALIAAAAAVQSLVARSGWGRGTCPACGAPPVLSIARGKEGERSLYCGRCGTGWAFPRLRCAACGERDHRRLGVLHAADEGEFRRVEVCDSCRGYLKSVATLDAPDVPALLRLDLATAGLDFAALDQGYRRR